MWGVGNMIVSLMIGSMHQKFVDLVPYMQQQYTVLSTVLLISMVYTVLQGISITLHSHTPDIR